jgi:hypothetical protein
MLLLSSEPFPRGAKRAPLAKRRVQALLKLSHGRLVETETIVRSSRKWRQVFVNLWKLAFGAVHRGIKGREMREKNLRRAGVKEKYRATKNELREMPNRVNG